MPAGVEDRDGSETIRRMLKYKSKDDCESMIETVRQFMERLGR